MYVCVCLQVHNCSWTWCNVRCAGAESKQEGMCKFVHVHSGHSGQVCLYARALTHIHTRISLYKASDFLVSRAKRARQGPWLKVCSVKLKQLPLFLVQTLPDDFSQSNTLKRPKQQLEEAKATPCPFTPWATGVSFGCRDAQNSPFADALAGARQHSAGKPAQLDSTRQHSAGKPVQLPELVSQQGRQASQRPPSECYSTARHSWPLCGAVAHGQIRC